MDNQANEVNPAKLLEAKQEELVKQIFPWLKAQGLVLVPEQIRLTIKINGRADTYKLTAADWKLILSDEWQWTPEELKFLKKLKREKNEWLAVPKDTKYDFETSMRTNFYRSRHPYFLSVSKTYEAGAWVMVGCIGKRLTPKERRLSR